MAVDTKPIEDAGRIGVARKYIVLKLPIAGQLKQSIEKDAPRKSLSPDPINLQSLLEEEIKSKTQIATANPSLPAIVNELPKSQELGHKPVQLGFQKKPIVKMGDMAFQGVDLTSEVGQVMTIDWRDPHPIFVIILVGEEELPFGIQKDLLCAKSPYYRQQFTGPGNNSLEYVVKLPNTTQAAFGCFQNFIYTGKVYDKEFGQTIPDYTLLLDVWKLATKLQMPPLRVAVLNAMADRRISTDMIPSTNMLIQAWKETEDGSGLRLMLIGWVAEHMRGNPAHRNNFAKSLPQEILSELVIVMSDLPPNNAHPIIPHPTAAIKHALPTDPPEASVPRPAPKRARKSAADVLILSPDADFDTKPAVKKPARKSEPNRRLNRRVSTAVPPTGDEGPDFISTPEKELELCRSMIDRMIQGPGFWTRLVGPFRKPVDPAVDNVPNYLDVVKKPMDLSTIKAKIYGGVYVSAGEFEKDVRLIFQNCYEYWTRDDAIWDTCQAFEKYFNEQWSARHRFKPKNIKAEVID